MIISHRLLHCIIVTENPIVDRKTLDEVLDSVKLSDDIEEFWRNFNDEHKYQIQL